MRKMCDKLWSRAVKADWNGRCAVCGGEARDSHHLIPRQHYATRYDIRNGIALCYQCHQACPKRSPHQNADGWMAWLEFNHHDLAVWYAAMNAESWSTVTTKNADFFRDVLRDLRQYVEPLEFESIVGIKFAQWLEEN